MVAGKPRLFYPLKLDREGNPISTIHRELAKRLQSVFDITAFKEKKEFRLSGVKLLNSHKNKYFDGLGMIKKSNSVLKSIDIVHAVPNIAIFPIIKKATKKGIPIVATVHEMPSVTMKKNKITQKVMSFLMKNATKVTAVSSFAAKDAKKQWGRSCTIIPNGVDTTLFNPKKKNLPFLNIKYKIPANKPLVLFVGMLIPNKNPQIISKIAKKIPSAHFIIVGKGPLAPKIKKAAQTTSNITYIPHLRPEILATFYASSSLLLFPAVKEGFGMVIVEAMASGIPTIGLQEGATPEIINKKTGIIAKTLKEIEPAVKKMLKNPKSYNRSTIARQAKRFSWDTIAKKYQKVYNEV